MTTVNMTIWEHRNSHPTTREVPLAHAHRMAMSGGFHRVVVTGEQDQILLEVKTRSFVPVSCDARSMAVASLREHVKR